MPIKDKSAYPQNWREISLRIRERDGNKCKFCGVPNGERGARDERGRWHSEASIRSMNGTEGEMLFGDFPMFKVADDGPPRYANTTDKPVEYVAVASDASGVIGYLWANDTDDAAGWMGCGAAGPEGTNGARPWKLLMFRYKAQGLTPTEALASMAQHPGGPVGRVVAGSRRRAESLEELRAIAKPRRWD